MKLQYQHLQLFFLQLLWLLLLLSHGVTVTSAQSSWQRVGTHQRVVEWITNRTVISVGWHGVMMKSTDAGETWRYIPSGTTDHILGVYFLDSLHGFTSLASGAILKTTDAGETWQTQDAPKQNRLSAIAFATAQRGFILADSGRALRTDDGGVSWITVIVNPNDPQLLNSIAFSDSLHGLIVGGGQNNGRVLRTTDGGTTWKRVGVDTGPRYGDVSCRGGRCVVVGHRVGPSRAGVILISSDYFESWRLADTTGLDHYPTTVTVIDSQRIMVMGELPRYTDTLGVLAVLTEDGGKTWKKIKSGIRTDIYWFNDVAVNGDSSLVGVGQNGCVVVSKDGGKTWQEWSYVYLYQVNIPPGDNVRYSDGYFFNERTGIVIGGEVPGSVLRTTDGGYSWTSIPVRQRLKQLYVANNMGNILALPAIETYNSGPLFRGEDQGSRWSMYQASFNKLYYSFTSGMQFLNPQEGFLATDSIIFTTTDGGLNWLNTINSPVSGSLIMSFQFLDHQRGWLSLQLGIKGIDDKELISRLYQTTDGGQSWMLKKEAFDTTKMLRFTSIYFRNAEEGWVGYGSGDDNGYHPKTGRVYHTTDGGEHWDSIEVNGAVTKIKFFSDSVGYIFGSNALLMKTTNAGKRWDREYLWPARASDSIVVFRGGVLTPSARTMMVYGHGVLVRGEFDMPITSVPGEYRSSSKDYTEVRVVPTISTNSYRRLEVRGSSVITKIVLRDIVGRMVRTLPVENIERWGEYQTVEINVDDIASGMYEVVVSSDDIQSSGRLVVMK